MSEDWSRWAACAKGDPEAAFGDLRTMHSFIQDTCGVCPVTGECLDAAMAVERGRGTARVGVAGGLLPGQRRTLEIRGSKARCEDCGNRFLPTSGQQQRCRSCRVSMSRTAVQAPWPADREHGTRSGYAMHSSRNEDACWPCKRAKAAASVQWRAQRRGVA